MKCSLLILLFIFVTISCTHVIRGDLEEQDTHSDIKIMRTMKGDNK